MSMHGNCKVRLDVGKFEKAPRENLEVLIAQLLSKAGYYSIFDATVKEENHGTTSSTSWAEVKGATKSPWGIMLGLRLEESDVIWVCLLKISTQQSNILEKFKKRLSQAASQLKSLALSKTNSQKNVECPKTLQEKDALISSLLKQLQQAQDANSLLEDEKQILQTELKKNLLDSAEISAQLKDFQNRLVFSDNLLKKIKESWNKKAKAIQEAAALRKNASQKKTRRLGGNPCSVRRRRSRAIQRTAGEKKEVATLTPKPLSENRHGLCF